MFSDFPFNTEGYTPQFCHSVLFILTVEGGLRGDGGYVNDPADKGGETKYGISKRAFPHVDIKAMTIDDAVALYHEHYWMPASCDDFAGPVALIQFDSAVQHGFKSANKMLQEIADVKADGIVGPATRNAVNGCDVEYLTARYVLRRSRYYARIIKNNPDQVRFIEGWHNRLVHLLNAAWECQ
ncbi:glycoside hydrolase family 108 protein [Vibrio cholerae]